MTLGETGSEAAASPMITATSRRRIVLVCPALTVRRSPLRLSVFRGSHSRVVEVRNDRRTQRPRSRDGGDGPGTRAGDTGRRGPHSHAPICTRTRPRLWLSHGVRTPPAHGRGSACTRTGFRRWLLLRRLRARPCAPAPATAAARTGLWRWLLLSHVTAHARMPPVRGHTDGLSQTARGPGPGPSTPWHSCRALASQLPASRACLPHKTALTPTHAHSRGDRETDNVPRQSRGHGMASPWLLAAHASARSSMRTDQETASTTR